MPQVLTTNAVILCPHGGIGTSIPTNPKWSVNGGVVLLENDLGTLACPFLILPCLGYQLRSMGLNESQIDGRKVILATDFNQTFTGLPLTMAEFHTTIDNSTPVPIPAGQPAPSLSPALADTVQPTVMGAPLALAFNSVTQQPAIVTASFTLSSAFPLKWLLTLLSEVPPSHSDITNGAPPNLVVAPAGGGWSTPALAVTMTMNAAYMSGLGIGKHHFFMTGVSQRGLSNLPHGAEIVLTVS
jgi:hypothetical protein